MIKASEFIKNYLSETADISRAINVESVEKMLYILLDVKEKGSRIFFLGVGGGPKQELMRLMILIKLPKFLLFAFQIMSEF